MASVISSPDSDPGPGEAIGATGGGTGRAEAKVSGPQVSRDTFTYKQQALGAQRDQLLGLVEEQAALHVVSIVSLTTADRSSSPLYILDTLTVMTYSESSSKAR